MPQPIVHILLATFNRSHLIIETLESIQQQTYPHFKCFITDDRSEDGTKEIVEQFCSHDPRFQYHLKPDTYKSGLSDNRNFGLDLAEKDKAEFIQFFDDDDIMHPEKLSLQIEPFFEISKIEMTLCKYRKFHQMETIVFDLNKADDNLCFIETSNLFENFLFNEINLNSLGPLWRSGTIKGQRFDTDLNYAEERDFYLRLFVKRRINYYPVNNVLFWYRKHPKAITSGLYIDADSRQNSTDIVDRRILLLALKNIKLSKRMIKWYLIKLRKIVYPI